MTKPIHHYNLDLDQLSEEKEAFDPAEGLAQTIQSISKDFASFTPSVQFQNAAIEALERMNRDTAKTFSKLAEVTIVPMQPIVDSLRIQLEPLEQLRKEMLELAIPPALNFPSTFRLNSREETLQTEDLAPVTLQPLHDSTPVVSLPDDALWTKVKCRFKDAHTLTVLYDDKKIGDYSHEELGFAMLNTRDRKPDKQWGLIVFISIVTENDDASARATTSLAAGHLKSTNEGVHKIKRSLSQRLQNVFGIDDDPFYPYDQHMGYRLKFSIEPEPDLRNRPFYPSGADLEKSEILSYKSPKKNTRNHDS